MELIKPIRPRRSQVTEIAYNALNVALAIVVLVVMLSTQTIWLPLLIVLLSKWRVFAVRPRYWRSNVLANLVDVIVGLSFVVILFVGLGSLAFQIGLTVAYILWLLLIKPRSKRSFVLVQSLIAVFLGTTALASVAYSLDSAVFVIGMWLIGFGALRHIFMHHDEPLTAYLSLLGGLIMAQLGWFAHHWLFAYALPGTGVRLAQVAIIATLMVFLTERLYSSYQKHGDKLRLQDVTLPVVFCIMLVVIMLTVFNQISPAGSI